MKELIEKVKEFNKAFNVELSMFPSLVDDNIYKLREKLMAEENSEYLEACESKDLIGVLDAICDMQYILFGTVIAHGLEDVFVDAFKEVHRSNMSKLDSDGRPVINGVQVFDVSKPMGKILKSSLYSPPNIEKFL